MTIVNFIINFRLYFCQGKNSIAMRDSNTWMYIVGGIVLLHFIVGFIYLIRKMQPRKEDKLNKDENSE